MCFRNHQNLYLKQAILKQKMYRKKKTHMPPTRYRDYPGISPPPLFAGPLSHVWCHALWAPKSPRILIVQEALLINQFPLYSFNPLATSWKQSAMEKMQALGDGACLRFLTWWTWLQWFWMRWNQQQTCCKKWNMLLDSQSLCRKQLKQLPHCWINLWRSPLELSMHG